MYTKRLVSTALLLGACFCIHAQVTPEHKAEILEEKVRDASVRAGLFEALDLPFPVEAANREVEVGGGAEPFIAVDPNDPSHLVLSYMDPQLNFPVYWSNDGGFTWTQSDFDMLATAQEITTGQMLGGGDPVLAFDANGRLHLTWIYLIGSFSGAEFTVYYAYSDDFGVTFQTDESSVVVHSGDLNNFDLIDRQWLAVDHTDGPYAGTVYMSGAYFGSSLTEPGEIVMSLAPGDTQFGNAVNVHGDQGAQYGNVQVDGLGNVHVSLFGFVDPETADGDVIHAVSNDGGATWTKTVLASDVGHSDVDPYAPETIIHGRENPAVSMAVHGSNVLVVWTSFEEGAVRAWMARSSDNGTTWTDAMPWGPDFFDEGYFHFMPAASMHWGRATVGWYVIDPEDLSSNYYIAESEDGGITWGEAEMVSSGSTDFMGDTAMDFYGDYNTAAKYSCNSYHAWGDGPSGSPVVYVVKYDGCAGSVNVESITPVGHTWQLGALYPNPVQEHVNLPFSGQLPREMDFQIYNASGQRVHQGTFDPQNPVLYVGELAAGSYVLHVTDGNGVLAARRFVK